MAKAKTRSLGTNLPVPQNDAEAEQMIAQLGALQRDHAVAQARHDASVAALETEHGRAVQAFEDGQKAIIEGLSIWASAHRERLTGGGRTKTVQLPTGTILWRSGTPSVTHRPLKVDQVVMMIESRRDLLLDLAEDKSQMRAARSAAQAEADRLGRFLRTTVALNKDAMHEDRELAEALPGVSFSNPGESFVVEPLASQSREVA